MMAGPAVAASGAASILSARCAQPARQLTIPAPADTPWYATRLGRDHVAGLSLGEGQVVAVLDTGVAPVPALVGALRPTIDALPAAGVALPAAEADPAPASGTAQDCDGRGTLLAGLVAARRGTVAAGPGPVLPGLASAAEILPVRVLASARDAADPAVLARGMTAAVAAGASVLLVGSAVADDPLLQAATQVALQAGIPVVAAAGDGNDESLAYPAAYDGVIAVAATGTQDTASEVNAVGRVSVGAPGTDIVGLGLDGGVVGGQAGSALGAALVAATVADVRSAFPDLSPEQLLDRIRATADRPGVAIPDPALGYGVVNPVTALTAPLDRTASPAVPGAVTVALAPEPVEDNWAVAVAATLLVLAAIAAAVVAGARRATLRNWRPAAPGTAVNESPIGAEISGPPVQMIANSPGNLPPQSVDSG